MSRTPLIASDHRAFQGRVVHDETGLIFPAGDAAGLAQQVKRLWTDADLYARLSVQGAQAWEQMQIEVKWAELIERWLRDSESDRSWLREHRLK